MNWIDIYTLLGMTKQDIYTQKMIYKAKRWGIMCDIAYASDLIEMEKQANLSHAKAMKRAVDWGEVGYVLDQDDLFDLHRMIFPDIEAAWVGDWRLGNVYIPSASVLLPDYTLVPSLMRHYLEDLQWWLCQSEDDPYHIMARLHLDFLRIHPFKDGNGRMSRVLLNHHAAFLGLPCIRITPDDREFYLDYLDYKDENGLANLFEYCSVEC
jgi:Fic family protein